MYAVSDPTQGECCVTSIYYFRFTLHLSPPSYVLGSLTFYSLDLWLPCGQFTRWIWPVEVIGKRLERGSRIESVYY